MTLCIVFTSALIHFLHAIFIRSNTICRIFNTSQFSSWQRIHPQAHSTPENFTSCFNIASKLHRKYKVETYHRQGHHHHEPYLELIFSFVSAYFKWQLDPLVMNNCIGNNLSNRVHLVLVHLVLLATSVVSITQSLKKKKERTIHATSNHDQL
jgi:hypothetical protein